MFQRDLKLIVLAVVQMTNFTAAITGNAVLLTAVFMVWQDAHSIVAMYIHCGELCVDGSTLRIHSSIKCTGYHFFISQVVFSPHSLQNIVF